MGKELEYLLGQVAGRLESFEPQIEAARSELNGLAQRVASLERGDEEGQRDEERIGNRLHDGEEQFQAIIKALGDLGRRLERLEASRKIGRFKKAMIEAAGAGAIAALGWLVTHLYTVSKIGHLIEMSGGGK